MPQLDGWKQIAEYLGVTERTAHRWEADLGLPVHRRMADKRGRAFALQEELDQWRAARLVVPSIGTECESDVHRSCRLRRILGLASVLAVLILASITLLLPHTGYGDSGLRPGAGPHVLARIPVGRWPAKAIISPDGREVYVSNSDDDSVSVINTKTRKVTHTIRVGSKPQEMVSDVDGAFVYVGQVGGNVSVIDTARKSATSIFTGGPVYDLALAPGGRKLYVAMLAAGLGKLDITTHQLTIVQAGVQPIGLVTSPDRSAMYVSYQAGGPGGRAGHDAIGRFDTARDVFLGSIAGFPYVGGWITLSPDGAQLWAPGADACSHPAYDHRACPAAAQGVVNVINTASNGVTASIGFPSHAASVAIYPDGSLAAVPVSSQVVLIDPATLLQVASVPVPANGLTFSADGALAYAPIPRENVVIVLEMMRDVDIEIKPPKESRMLQLLIHNTAGLDPFAIDPATLRLSGAAPVVSASGLFGSGDPSQRCLVAEFNIDEVKVPRNDPRVVLSGRTFGGVHIRGVARLPKL